MSTAATTFDELAAELEQGGPEAALSRLCTRLNEQGLYHELYQAKRLVARGRLGLPLAETESADSLDPHVRDQLEEALIAACKEVGVELLKSGRIREGWEYLRTSGQWEAGRDALADIEPDEDNLDEFVEVALQEQLDPARGFGAMLEHYGTCNSITALDGMLPRLAPEAQQKTVEQLVEHLHSDLKATLVADISHQEGADPDESLSIGALVVDRDWLFASGAYHIDTTHLASTVRFARILHSRRHLELALDLTEYGRRLARALQYDGDEPFRDIHPSHALYFGALLGEDVDAAAAYFRERAEALDREEFGSVPSEVYVGLLSRVNRPAEALAEYIRLIPADAQVVGLAPSLLDLARQAGDWGPFLERSRAREDLLGYTLGLVLSRR